MAMPDLRHLTTPAVEGARRTAESSPENKQLIRARPGKPFTLVAYPKQSGNWAPLEIKAGEGVPKEDVGVWWLCVPQRVEVRPGVGGHRTIKAGMDPREAYHRAHSNIERRGGIVLRDSDYEYGVAIDCIDPITRRPGHVYTDVWSKPLPQLDDERIAFEFDHQRFRRWLLALHRSGVLPEMDPRIAAKRSRQLEGRVVRRSGLNDLNDEQRAKHIADAEKALGTVKAAEPPTKPRRSRATAQAEAGA